MRDFARRAIGDRAAFFTEAAARRSVPAWMLEKDFWVCFLLGELFQLQPWRDHLVFKGGTSLSKVFGVIQRFSEDVDLSVSPEFLGMLESRLEDAPSPTQRQKRHKELEAACVAAVQERFAPLLAEALAPQLGEPESTGWNLVARVDETSQSPVVLFRYPAAAAYSGYIRAEVKIEFGSLTDQRPVGDHKITSMVAEEFPRTFTQASARVVALEVERTFWEKATILHAEYHRRPDLPMRDRYSRHYSDLAALIRHPLGERSMRRFDLLERVVHHKSRFFASSWASYETAKPGTIRITPPDFRLKELEADYAKMADMFLRPAPAFSEIMATLRAAETAINMAKGGRRP